jgi:hypothetical protein
MGQKVDHCDNFNVAVKRKTVCLPEIKFPSFIPSPVILMTELSWPIIKCLLLLLLLHILQNKLLSLLQFVSNFRKCEFIGCFEGSLDGRPAHQGVST